MAAHQIQKGDTFFKMDSQSYWVVQELLHFPAVPMHVRLVERGGNQRTVTLAARELLDRRKYELKAAAATDGRS